MTTPTNTPPSDSPAPDAQDADTPPTRHPARAQWALIGAAGAVIVLVWGAARLVGHWLEAQPPPPPPAVPAGSFRPTRGQWATLKVAEVKAATFATQVVADGVIAYNDDATTPVFSPYSGRVTQVLARPGDLVRRGAALMAVDASESAQGQSDLATARAQWLIARKNEQRQHALYDAKAAALKDWMQSQTDLAVATSALDAVRNRLRILGRTDAEIAALEADTHHVPRAGGVVLAPIAGTVTQRQVGVGQYIAAGAATPVYTIADLSSVWLVANVRETDAADVRAGQHVSVRVPAYPQRVFDARIVWVAPALDASTHRLPVRAQVDNTDGLLKPQMFASFDIRASSDASAPAVPKSALVYEGDDAHVYVARDDGTIALRSVHVGRSAGDLIEVVSGLAAGEKVVSAGTLFIDRATDAGA